MGVGGHTACGEGGHSKVGRLGGGVGQATAFHSCVEGRIALGHREEGGTCVEEEEDRESAFGPCLPHWGSHSAYPSASCEEGRSEGASVAVVLNLFVVVC